MMTMRPRSLVRSSHRVLVGRRQSGVAQLWIPVGPASLGREVEQIPLRVDGIDVTRILLRLGRPVRKTSSGYDLKDLFIGSSGTLGVITEVTVQLHPVPEHVHTLRVFFPSILAAAQASYALMASALPVARIELVDEFGMRSINRYLKRGYSEQTALFLEFHSSTAAAIEEEVRLVEELVRDAGAVDISIAHTRKEQTEQ